MQSGLSRRLFPDGSPDGGVALEVLSIIKATFLRGVLPLKTHFSGSFLLKKLILNAFCIEKASPQVLRLFISSTVGFFFHRTGTHELISKVKVAFTREISEEFLLL